MENHAFHSHRLFSCLGAMGAMAQDYYRPARRRRGLTCARKRGRAFFKTDMSGLFGGAGLRPGGVPDRRVLPGAGLWLCVSTIISRRILKWGFNAAKIDNAQGLCLGQLADLQLFPFMGQYHPVVSHLPRSIVTPYAGVGCGRRGCGVRHRTGSATG